MSASRCPTCGAPVDPLLAPAPVVLGSRVVMCCSDACRSEAREAQAAATRVTPSPTGEACAEVPTQRSTRSSEPFEPSPHGATSAPVGAQPATRDTPSGIDSDQGATRRALRRAALLALGAGLILAAALILWRVAAHGQELARPEQSGGAPAQTAPTTPRSTSPRSTSPRSRADLPRPAARPRGVLALTARSRTILDGYLGSPVVRFRLTAADVLAEAGEVKAMAVLRSGATNRLWTTRLMAAEALARSGDPRGLDVLRAGLRSPRRSLRWAAAFALARQGDGAGARLIRQLAAVPKHRLTCREALARLGDERSKRYLRGVLDRSRAPYERLRAAVALGLAGDRAGLFLLKEQLAKPGIHLGVALALQRLEAPEARAALRRALGHHSIRIQAARALKRSGTVSDLASLSRDLRSRADESRLTAAGAIVVLSSQTRAEAR